MRQRLIKLFSDKETFTNVPMFKHSRRNLE